MKMVKAPDRQAAEARAARLRQSATQLRDEIKERETQLGELRRDLAGTNAALAREMQFLLENASEVEERVLLGKF